MRNQFFRLRKRCTVQGDTSFRSIQQPSLALRRFTGDLKPPAYNQRWTAEEITQMQSLMKEGTPIRKIADILGRGHQAVRTKYNTLGSGPMKFRAPSPITPREWTSEEVSMIQRLRLEGHTASAIADIAGRTIHSINSKFADLRSVRVVQYKQGPWSPEELKEFQRMKAERKTASEISRALNRSYAAVSSAFRKQRLPGVQNSWTAEESTHLLDLMKKSTPWFQIAQHFPRRSQAGIIAHYYEKLKQPLTTSGRRRWTDDETKTLEEMIKAGSSHREIASRLGRSYTSVRYKGFELFGENLRQDAGWTESEIAALANLRHSGLSWKEVSKTIGNRSADACLQKYGLTYGRRAKWFPWSEDELAAVKRLRDDGNTWKEVAAVIKTRSAEACKIAHANLAKSG